MEKRDLGNYIDETSSDFRFRMNNDKISMQENNTKLPVAGS